MATNKTLLILLDWDICGAYSGLPANKNVKVPNAIVTYDRTFMLKKYVTKPSRSCSIR
ncbi:MAG: hypothetical protein WC505_02990 [Patescibacteria group bacterium]